MSSTLKSACAAVLALFSLPAATWAAPVTSTIYITVDNGVTNAIRTLNPLTGQFTLTCVFATLRGQVFASLTVGNAGTIYGASTNGNLYTVTTNGTATQLGTVSFASPGYFGLAYTGDGFVADNDASAPFPLYAINSSGTISSTIGQMLPSGYNNSGSLVYGPGNNLYLTASTGPAFPPNLYSVNTSTGAATLIGGLGTNLLVLAYDGSTLFGVDGSVTSNIPVYSINTTTGVATPVSTISGLPAGWEVDSAAAVPEPASLSLLAASGLLLLRRRRPSPN